MIFDPRSPDFQHLFIPFLTEMAVDLCQLRARRDFRVYSKHDDSPVTSADIWASDAWCSFLITHFPDDSIVSEEHPEFRSGTSGRTWFIDPIDGTKQFIDQSSDFYVLAGLEENGKPIFGLHLNPEKKLLIVGTPGIGVFTFNLSAQSPSPVAISRIGSKSSLFHVKGVSPEDRQAFYAQFNFTKPPFPSPHVHLLSPLFWGYSGFATFRETWYWDLLAPAAIAMAAGFYVEVEALNGQNDFSDPSYKCASLFCLPPELVSDVLPNLTKLKNQNVG